MYILVFILLISQVHFDLLIFYFIFFYYFSLFLFIFSFNKAYAISFIPKLKWASCIEMYQDLLIAILKLNELLNGLFEDDWKVVELCIIQKKGFDVRDYGLLTIQIKVMEKKISKSQLWLEFFFYY